MRNTLLFLVLFFSITPLSYSQTPTDREEILRILQRQENDWNRGDVKSFMVGFWESDSLTFIGSKDVTYGYQPIYNNYLKRYPDKASMGTLKFTIKEVLFPGKKVAYVIGKFHLKRPEKGDAEGHFSIVWRKIKGKWVIISDHSS